MGNMAEGSTKSPEQMSHNMEVLMSGKLGPVPGKVVVLNHSEWRKVTDIGTSSNYLFENTCGMGDTVQVEPGDAVFALCSGNSDRWTDRLKEAGMKADGSVYRGQASQVFYLVSKEE